MNVSIRRLRVFFLLVASFLASSAPGLCADEKPPQAVIAKNVMVPMRDGVRLATDVYFPAADGKRKEGAFPVVLIRTPYDKDTKESDGMYFADHDYVFVAQDVRGRYQSEGDFYIYVNEGPDGYDCVEWVARQPWCDGNVGTYGGSYQAATQNALAVLAPSALRTMFVVNGTSNYVEDGAGRGGAFALLHNMTYCFRLAASGKEADGNEDVEKALGRAYDDLAEWLKVAPLDRYSPLRFAPTYQQWYADWRAHSTYDDYWKQLGYNFEEYYARYPDIPVCLVGGWYDIFKRGTLRNFEGLRDRSALTRLIMGPWTHSAGVTYAGDVDFGNEAKLSLREEALRWYDQFLKGQNRGLLDEPRVKYFLMNAPTGDSAACAVEKNQEARLQSGGSWQTADDWPPPGTREQRFYLHSDGALHAQPPTGASEPTRYEFDPTNPVATLGGNIDSGKHLVPRGAQRQVVPADHPFSNSPLPLSARADVLVFETPPLGQPLVVTGPVSARLWVASDAKDTDFTAKLIDVYPPSDDYPEGYAVNLEDGILRMRFRNSRTKEELMEPGTIYPVTIDLWATANRFEKGHRIRLEISSSNFPMYDVNPNTGEPLGAHTRLKTAINSLYHDRERPSCLVLTVRGKNNGAALAPKSGRSAAAWPLPAA